MQLPLLAESAIASHSHQAYQLILNYATYCEYVVLLTMRCIALKIAIVLVSASSSAFILLKVKLMTYRAPLLDRPEDKDFFLSNDHYRCLTSAQLARFASWSIETGKPVIELMQGFTIEQDRQWSHAYGDQNAVVLTGRLPHCDLFGGIMPDGSTHT